VLVAVHTCCTCGAAAAAKARG
jgi:hypothetical protein